MKNQIESSDVILARTFRVFQGGRILNRPAGFFWAELSPQTVKVTFRAFGGKVGAHMDEEENTPIALRAGIYSHQCNGLLQERMAPDSHPRPKSEEETIEKRRA